MFGLFGKRSKDSPPPPELQEAIDTRDRLFVDADKAMREVDKVQDRIIKQYRLAEKLREEGLKG